MSKSFNSDKFFGLFFPPSDISKQNKLNTLDPDSPEYKVGMFVKLIINGTIFSNNIVGLFSKSSQPLDVDDIKKVSMHMMHYRAYHWIEGFDLENEDWIEALGLYPGSEVRSALSSSIKFFEDLEEYERCAFLAKILDLIKNP